MTRSVPMKRMTALALGLVLVFISGCSGFKGVVIDKETGAGVSGAVLTFSRENANLVLSTASNSAGTYSISLPGGRYWVTCTHPDFEDYATYPGFFVVTGREYQTGNFFLRKPVFTTVILIRHAEKKDASADPDLAPAGVERAEKLTHVLWKAGVTGVYATSTKRSLQTVGPLADSLRLPIHEYSGFQELHDRILTDHNGDVVLVASHSGEVESFIRSFGGGQVPAIGDEFDNMFLLSLKDGQAQVMNVQYGNSTLPDTKRGTHPLKTLILATPVETGAPGEARMDELIHALVTADVGRVYVNPSDPSPQRLLDAMGVQSAAYDPSRLSELAEAVRSDAAHVVFVIGSRPVLSRILRTVDANPFPALLDGETDNLIVLTMAPSGSVRSVNLQYGAENR